MGTNFLLVGGIGHAAAAEAAMPVLQAAGEACDSVLPSTHLIGLWGAAADRLGLVSVLQGCVGSLLVLHHTAYEAQDMSDPFLPIKDKYREASRHCVGQLLPLPHLPTWLFEGGVPC